MTVPEASGVAVWRSCNGFGHVNEVALHRVRLVLGWMTQFAVCNHAAT